jgi:hypothetical protein
MVAAATAILKDIDLSNKSLDRLVRRSNLASSAKRLVSIKY